MECVILPPENYYNNFQARVAELVDAADSKSAVRKDVLVRFQSRAPSKNPDSHCVSGFFTTGSNPFINEPTKKLIVENCPQALKRAIEILFGRKIISVTFTPPLA